MSFYDCVIERCAVDGSIVDVRDAALLGYKRPPCALCALKAEFEEKLKALERRAVPSLRDQLKHDRDF